jgi:hypothetical protein
MEMNEKLIRELKKKFEIETYKKEAEIVEYWQNEIDTLYKKRYEDLSTLHVEIKNLMGRMNNRVLILKRMAREEG